MTSAISKSLDLLEKSRMFEVKCENGFYEVSFKDDQSNHPISAGYNDDDQAWSYYINGLYNSGSNWVAIDVTRLNALMSFCESLSGDAE